MSSRAASFSSVVHMFHHRVGSTPDADAITGKRGGDWYTWTWRDVGDRVRRLACGLHALGLSKGERCSILSNTRPEWVVADLAILCAAGATTTIYPSNGPDECAYILADSGTVVCFAEDQTQVDKLLGVRDQLPDLRHVVVIDGKGTDDGWVLPLTEVERQGRAWDDDNPQGYDGVADAVGPSDIATLIYTSGTTGPPKGVILTHDNWVFEGEAIDKLAVMSPSDRQYLFLPLAHSFAKVLEIAFIRLGVPTIIDGSVDDLVANLQDTRPTVVGAVPRIFEKVYNKVVTGAHDAGGAKLRIFHWAIGVGTQVSELRQRGEEPRGALAAKHRLADRLVFSKLKATFGGRIKYFISGGAPLAREIAEFFHAADILVLEGYGLTESSAASCVNRPDAYRFGTVGPPVPGVEARLAPDGEIELGGRGIMQGYYNLPDATAAALTEDGWLRTGDIGLIDDEGFVKITDRKKDIIVTAGGKNIAPQNIENTLKARCQYVSQVVMHGDTRPFCVALITISEDAVGAWAREKGLVFDDYASLAALPQVHDLIWRHVEMLNAELASYETIKQIAVLDHDLSQERGELTPTLKVKRRIIAETHGALLDGFYEGRAAAP